MFHRRNRTLHQFARCCYEYDVCKRQRYGVRPCAIIESWFLPSSKAVGCRYDLLCTNRRRPRGMLFADNRNLIIYTTLPPVSRRKFRLIRQIFHIKHGRFTAQQRRIIVIFSSFCRRIAQYFDSNYIFSGQQHFCQIHAVNIPLCQIQRLLRALLYKASIYIELIPGICTDAKSAKFLYIFLA